MKLTFMTRNDYNILKEKGLNIYDYNYMFYDEQIDSILLKYIANDYTNAKYIKEQTDEICMMLLNHRDINAFKYIINPTKEMIDIYNERLESIAPIKKYSYYDYEYNQEYVDKFAISHRKFLGELEYKDYYWFVGSVSCKVTELLRYVPKEFLTESLCYYAVSRNPSNIQYVPPEIQTEEMCEHAVNFSSYLLFNYCRIQTENICLLALNNDLSVFSEIKNQTYKICEYFMDRLCATLIDMEDTIYYFNMIQNPPNNLFLNMLKYKPYLIQLANREQLDYIIENYGN